MSERSWPDLPIGGNELTDNDCNDMRGIGLPENRVPPIYSIREPRAQRRAGLRCGKPLLTSETNS